MKPITAMLEKYAADQDMLAPRAWAENLVEGLAMKYTFRGVMLGTICSTIIFLALTVLR